MLRNWPTNPLKPHTTLQLRSFTRPKPRRQPREARQKRRMHQPTIWRNRPLTLSSKINFSNLETSYLPQKVIPGVGPWRRKRLGTRHFLRKPRQTDLILIAAKAIDGAASKHDDFNTKQVALNHTLKNKDDFDQETISKVKQHAGLSDQRDGLRNLLNQANEAVKQALSSFCCGKENG